MESAKINGISLEYEIRGSGEAVLLIPPIIARGFVPFASAPELVDRYRLIRYHKRGWGGSTHTRPPVSIEDHAADAAAFLDDLGIDRAHVAGHSSGAAVALQLALDRSDLVHTLALLEPSLLSLPNAKPLLEKAAPSVDAYCAGEHETAVTGFLSLVSGLDRDRCRSVIEENIPGGVAEAIEDADTLFGIELPALGAWEFGREQAAAISQPILSVVGTETSHFWMEVAHLLRSWMPQVEECTIEGVGHLLQMQHPQPVVREVAAFLRRHPMPGTAYAQASIRHSARDLERASSR